VIEMTGGYFEFALCDCGHKTPIRPPKIAPPPVNREKSDEEAAPVAVACAECKNVFEADQLTTEYSQKGLSPYVPDAPLHAFQVALPCERAGCDTPLTVIAVRDRDAKPESVRAEKAAWA